LSKTLLLHQKIFTGICSKNHQGRNTERVYCAIDEHSNNRSHQDAVYQQLKWVVYMYIGVVQALDVRVKFGMKMSSPI
jgi:hypothetical protein